ncbi:hypothetical protein GCM10027037_07990 [Mucilaginibacter koreensis]
MSKLKLIFLLNALFATGAATAQTVTLDYYFNHETRKSSAGQVERYHYLWEDTGNTGFSKWAEAFKQQGARLASLEAAPTLKNLKGSDIYIIVDPDNAKESAQPNYIESKDAKRIAAWVKAGGVLVMMANDSANVELNHLNILAAKFGLHFNNDLQNRVTDDQHFNDGIPIIASTLVFPTAKQLFLKDVCSIKALAPAHVILKSPGGAPIAVAVTYGKGTVFAVGDPWLYNEYVNGRLPVGFANDKAMRDLTEWLLKQVKK